jgi:hypothetical protein
LSENRRKCTFLAVLVRNLEAAIHQRQQARACIGPKGITMRRFILALVLGGVLIPANAMLISRVGGAAYYDDILNITWLADANYAKTSGYLAVDSIGQMTWDESETWVGALNTAIYLGANKWRLPAVIDTAHPDCNFSRSGGTDCGYNVDTSTGEMAHLFYVTLGNLAWYDTSGNGPQPGWGLSNTGPFTNIETVPVWPDNSSYWSGTELASDPSIAWMFNFFDGEQNRNLKWAEHYAWPVLDGDIGAIPIPATAYLFASALGLLGWMRRGRFCR